MNYVQHGSLDGWTGVYYGYSSLVLHISKCKGESKQLACVSFPTTLSVTVKQELYVPSLRNHVVVHFFIRKISFFFFVVYSMYRPSYRVMKQWNG